MHRRLFSQLVEWQESDRRKPLILMGARQVGKTYLLQEFGKLCYQDFLYLNFEDNPDLKRLFVDSLSPKEILANLAIEFNSGIVEGQTLIILDEIEECPEALNSLKYFYEQQPHQHIVAAGSLLGVKLSHTKGFPVGKVDFLHLYPLSFFEFLEATGEQQLYHHLEEHLTRKPLSDFLHNKLIRLFKIYLYVGGMPEAVAVYVETGDFGVVRAVQDAILKAYSLDFAKHAPSNQVMKITQVWDAIPGQLAKENKKFIYSTIRKGARAKEFEVALQWLFEAGLIHRVTQVSNPMIPLEAYSSFEIFKIYLIDVGLLGAMTRLSAKALIDENALFREFRGSLVENYVAQELARSGYRLHYWTSSGTAEVDYVIEHDDMVFPLEVKSGTSKKKKSLLVYGEKYSPRLLLRSSGMNLKLDGKVLNCPLYLLSRIGRYIG